MKLQTKADLESLITSGVPEGLTLDYKRSDSLSKDNSKRIELCKDVSAFANSAGGRLIIGVPEQNQVPQPLDSGVDKKVITPEWIEQVLNSSIQPRIEGLQITQISAETGDDQVFYVIDVPQATARAPHQAPDKKYYRRFNFQSVPMEDYEIRDALRRATTPALSLRFEFNESPANGLITFPREADAGVAQPRSNLITIRTTLYNESQQPAEYVHIGIYVHPRLVLDHYPGFTLTLETLTTPVHRLMNVLTWQFAIPKDIPVFKELPRQVPSLFGFTISVSDAFSKDPIQFPFGYRLRCPGFDTERWGFLRLADQRLEIEFGD
jgi:hypothetical protein